MWGMASLKWKYLTLGPTYLWVVLESQVGQDNTHMNVLLELFVLAAKREVFHQLRTVEQLGYVVFLMSK